MSGQSSERDPIVTAQEAQTPQAPAGWYQDPEHSGSQRFWDGTAWTDSRAPLTQAPAGRSAANDGLATAGYVMAVLLPIVGVVIAIILYARGDNRGTPVLLTAIVVVFLFLALFGA